MNDEPLDLKRAQRWMQAVITHPGGIPAGVASDDARQCIDVPFEDLQAVVTRSQALTGAERLAIYSRAYHARLLKCFQAEYPCLVHALGDDLFNRFVYDYLQQYPSQSYTLYHLGERFPDFLAETRPDAEAPPDGRERWPDFIIDLATLERAFAETYDGPGAEGQPLASARQLVELPDEQFLEVRVVPVPCLRLLAFRYPVAAYFAAVRHQQDPDLPDPADTYLAVTRRNYQVYFLDLSRLHYDLLRALMAHRTVAEAIAQAAPGTVPQVLLADLRTWLARWAEEGFFNRLVCSPEGG